MSAVQAKISDLKEHARAVLIRNGVTFKGTLFLVGATSIGDDAYWMLRTTNRSCAVAIRPGDEVWTSSDSPCFGCAVAPIRLVHKCKHCFDRFL